MKIIRNLLLCAGAALLAAGCLPSLNPLYTEKDLIFDPALVGRWAEKPDDKDSWTFEKRDEHSYNLVIRDDDTQSPLIVHLVKLGGHRFLDLMLRHSGLKETKLDGVFQLGLIPGHLLAKVNQTAPALRLAFLNPEWLDKLLKENPKAIAHHRIEGDLAALTASTKELQAFVLKYAGDTNAFREGSELRKVATPAAAK